MAVNDSEERTKAILNKRIEKGSEIEQFNEIQGQITSLQAEQRNNLNEQRVVSEMEALNNQTLAQAAGVLAAGNGGGNDMVTPVSVNPGTNAILGKYGLNKPSKVSKITHNTIKTQSPQKINITNTTNTTNNIHVSQPQTPAASNIPMRTGGIRLRDDSERFKVWVNNAFAKQNEAAAIRDKEYKKREWSLTRSTNKMIRKMGEVGKTIGKAVSPKNIGNLMGDQLKIILFLLGFQFVARNIESILRKVDGFLYWISGGSIGVSTEGKTSGSFLGTIKEFFGGDKNKSFIENIKDAFSELFDGLGNRVESLFDARKEAVNQIKFPEIDLTEGLLPTVTKLATYLADVVSAAVTGSSALQKSISRDIVNQGRAGMLETSSESDRKWSRTNSAADYINTGTTRMGENTSLGDAVLTIDGYKSGFKMLESDYNSFGGLTNNAGASVRQATYLSQNKNISSEQVMSGFSALSNTAKYKKEILVPGNFIDFVGNYFNIREYTDRLKYSLKLVKVRYILVKKTMAEYNSEKVPGFVDTFMTEYAENRINSMIGGGSYSYLVNEAKMYKNRGYNSTMGLLNLIGSKTRAFNSALSAWGETAFIDDPREYTIMMVRVDDPKYSYEIYPSVRKKDGSLLVDDNNNTYYVLTEQSIRNIENEIKKKHNVANFSFDSDNLESLQLINKQSSIHNGQGLSTDFLERMGGVEDIRQIENVMWNSSSSNQDDELERFIVRYNTYNPFSEDASNLKGDFSKLTTEQKRAINKLYTKLGNSGLGLTSAQIAGLIGNLLQESGLDPGIIGDNGRSYGIAQWNDDRLEEFEKKYGEKPNKDNLDKQIDFIIHELHNKESEALRKVIGTEGSGTNSAIAAQAWMDHYERPSNGMVENRQRYAANAYAYQKNYLEENGAELLSLNRNSTNPFKVGGYTMSVYDLVRDNKELQVRYDDEGRRLDGNDNILNPLHISNNTELNLARKVHRGEMNLSDLVIHENISRMTPDEVQAFGERLGQYKKNVSTSIFGDQKFSIARLLAAYHEDSDKKKAINTITSYDWIQILKLLIKSGLCRKDLDTVIKNYYVGDLDDDAKIYRVSAVFKALYYLVMVVNPRGYLGFHTIMHRSGSNINTTIENVPINLPGSIEVSGTLWDSTYLLRKIYLIQSKNEWAISTGSAVVLGYSSDSVEFSENYFINSDKMKKVYKIDFNIYAQLLLNFINSKNLNVNSSEAEIFQALKRDSTLDIIAANSGSSYDSIEKDDIISNLTWKYETTRQGELADLDERSRVETVTQRMVEALGKYAVSENLRNKLVNYVNNSKDSNLKTKNGTLHYGNILDKLIRDYNIDLNNPKEGSELKNTLASSGFLSSRNGTIRDFLNDPNKSDSEKELALANMIQALDYDKVGIKSKDYNSGNNSEDVIQMALANDIINGFRNSIPDFDINNIDKTSQAFQALKADIIAKYGVDMRELTDERLEQILKNGANSYWYKKLIEGRGWVAGTSESEATAGTGTYEHLDLTKTSRTYQGLYREKKAELLGRLEPVIKGEVSESQTNIDLDVKNAGQLLTYLSGIKYLKPEDISSYSAEVKNLDNMAVTDKTLLNAILQGKDINQLINNNTIVSGQYLKGILQVLTLIAAGETFTRGDITINNITPTSNDATTE